MVVPTWFQTTPTPTVPGVVSTRFGSKLVPFARVRRWCPVRKEDVASGDQSKVGARVDAGVYAAFRDWVEETNGGRVYSNVGSALERAMLEYMTDDDLHDTIESIDDQTALNEALLRQVLDRLDEEDGQKVKGINSDTTSIPKGKNPGDRKKRELHVIRALYESDGADKWHIETIEQAVREVAGVSSPQTVDDYIESIVDTRAFMSTRKPNTWRMDRDAVGELLAENQIPVSAE